MEVLTDTNLNTFSPIGKAATIFLSIRSLHLILSKKFCALGSKRSKGATTFTPLFTSEKLSPHITFLEIILFTEMQRNRQQCLDPVLNFKSSMYLQILKYIKSYTN
ncbi:hypothetical protein ACJX0J_006913 [Zea mays]